MQSSLPSCDFFPCAASDEQCTTGDLRLVDGEFINEGRVEVCLNNHWGTICDESFGSEEVEVICNQLGFTNG